MGQGLEQLLGPESAGHGMLPLMAAVLGASLLGSLHCAGMCGAFVAMAVTPDERGRTPLWALSAMYNLGRLATYVTLGLVAGAVGAGFDLAGEGAGLQRPAAVGAALVMVVFGGASLLRSLGWSVPRAPLPRGWRDAAVRAHVWVGRFAPPVRALLIGTLTTMLPCGWLYMFVAVAAGTGSPLAGPAVMAAFWLGTLPVVASLGVVVQRATGALRRRLPVVASALLVAAGLAMLAVRADGPGRGASASGVVSCHGK